MSNLIFRHHSPQCCVCAAEMSHWKFACVGRPGGPPFLRHDDILNKHAHADNESIIYEKI